MKTLIALFAVATSFALQANAGTLTNDEQTDVSQACQIQVYRKINKLLPANQYVSDMIMAEGKVTSINVEITTDQGDENLCIKLGTVKITDEEGDSCSLGKLKVDESSSDCG